MSNMKYSGMILLAITATLISGHRNFAESQVPCYDQTKGVCGNTNYCSQGCKTCRMHVETLKVKKHCYYIECKDICIPPVRFPWQKCCDLKCGKIKTVRVLKKHNYTCEKCGYKWTVECNCDSCSSGNCVTAVQKPLQKPVQKPAQSAKARHPLAPATLIRK